MKKLIGIFLLIASVALVIGANPPTVIQQVFSGKGTATTPASGAASDYVISALSPGYAAVEMLDYSTDTATLSPNITFWEATNTYTIATAVAAGKTNLLITPSTIGLTTNGMTVVVRQVSTDTYQALHIKSYNTNTLSGANETTAFALAAGDKLYAMSAAASLVISTNATGPKQIGPGASPIYRGHLFSPTLVEVTGTNAASVAINLISGSFSKGPVGLNP